MLIDPVTSLLLRNTTGAVTTTTNTDLLAKIGNEVQGVSADGISEAIVRIPANSVGENLFVTVVNDQGETSGSVAEDGGLIQIGSAADLATSSIGVSAVATDAGPMAFAVYVAPKDFARNSSDFPLVQRKVTLFVQSSDVPGATSTKDVTVVRPPVVLVHGLWASREDFKNFGPLWDGAKPDSRFVIKAADYSDFITGITSSIPQFSSSVLAQVRENALGLAFNAPHVLSQINDFIADYRQVKKVAAVKADVVAHSMGGIVVRAMFASLPEFSSEQNFGSGPINKLITIGTPHLGTPVAQQMIVDANSCIRNALAHLKQLISLSSLTISGAQVNGAFADLQGDGFGGALSPALATLSSSEPFPTAHIDGLMNAINLSTVDCDLCASTGLDVVCSADPLSHELTRDHWPDIFAGEDSDALVSVFSQTNRISNAGSPLEFVGVVHSPGILKLDLTGPTELDKESGVPLEVINLLNETKTGSDFQGSASSGGVID